MPVPSAPKAPTALPTTLPPHLGLPELRLGAAKVDEAARQLFGVVTRTPLQHNARLSAKTPGQVWVKREDTQPVRSYKLRGAYRLLASLDDTTTEVVCASAGNHAQGVAYACSALGIRGTVFLPSTTPPQKRARIASIGGDWITITIAGETYDDAHSAATAHSNQTGAVIVPAFDDLRTLVGQGTVAVEIIAQLGRAPDRIIVPVGGGGLLAGMATWLRARHSEVDLIGVEPEGAASMAAALTADHPVTLPDLDTFVDGAAVRRAGDITFPIIRDSGAKLVSVSTAAVCVEMLDLYQVDGIIAEPAGALATSAIGRAFDGDMGGLTVCVVSGGNNDVTRYPDVMERASHEQR
ncbi:pyridoxal-phosphate dependent enzyme [Umezawaea endophytica]|uniref:threonine ammonia-lyase n=1 Tax=Umezawaea endophytica TaxID=1654476 RepID=A0A9X2VM08_9PSEU|nr:pyridoxal-phosphate dependent enzyme [Umezawaea endophytica]MCS7478584.1 pyridoxal-phosphate dependent enzyme [Umezawaea endophytica]